ncbi:MAG: GntR family transcriptional regulator [Sphingomonas sp.]
MSSCLSGKIVKLELPQEAAARLRRSIVLGELPPGFRLVERDLAMELGISRTPVRHALFVLQEEGLVSSCEGRGLLVSPLEAGEITDIYQLIAALERAAVRHTTRVTHRMLADLKNANRRFGSAEQDVSRIIGADVAWHRALTGFSTNQAVNALLEPLRVRSERYERAFFRTILNRDRSVEDHGRIEALLEAGDLAGAAETVEAHWIDAITPMLAALNSARPQPV